ncbi:MAG: cytochrome c biogenesis protein CcsA [Candidatus Omnitrophica bacterium]|nr:cytochrome c biogenesis protein CcsA [Candidatus Omnitrophota bacterium]
MIGLHLVLIFFSYAAFAVAVATGVSFLLKERWLKRKDPRVLRSGTIPLELLDEVNRWAVVVGFAFFSALLIQGHLLARRSWQAFRIGDSTEIWSGITWAAYALVLALRIRMGLRGRRVVFMSVMSFGVAVTTLVGVSRLVGGRHLFF